MEHLELLADNISYILEQNYRASVDGFDDIESQAMEMADMMAEGIVAQFHQAQETISILKISHHARRIYAITNRIYQTVSGNPFIFWKDNEGAFLFPGDGLYTS